MLGSDPDCIQNSGPSTLCHAALNQEPQIRQMYRRQTTVQPVQFWLRATCTRRERLCSATAQAVQRNAFSPLCTLVKPRTVSNIPLRLTNFPQFPKCKLTFSSHLFYFAPVHLGNFILLNTFCIFGFVESSLTYLTDCKTKITKYDKNTFL